MKKTLLTICLISLIVFAFGYQVPASNPCSVSINELNTAYNNNEVFRMLIDQAFENMQQVPEGYLKGGNPWIGKEFQDLLKFLEEWATFLPQAVGSTDDGLTNIQKMDLFAYNNPFGRVVFQTSPGRELFNQFVKERGEYMNSPESLKYVAGWLADPRIEKEDYVIPDESAPNGGFEHFNAFFSRELKNQALSRPQTLPERDYVITAPTDALMNSIPMTIVDNTTMIKTKGLQELNIQELLAGSKYWEKFLGGTALSCILMPNTYHRYHSPVDGKVIEARVLQGALLGMEDFPTFVPKNGNVGYYGSDFSAFENYQRGFFIIDTGKYGLVAAIPVGLSTIGSVVFEERFLELTKPVPVKRGDELGHFLYGGSLVILVFEPGKYSSSAIQVRLGNQIGTFDTDTND